jgi:predicted nucleotide-binding protein
MKEKCILCEENVDISIIPGKDEYSIACDTCGNYVYDNFFKNSYLTLPKEERAMISAYTRESYEYRKDLPKLADPDSLKDIIARYKNKTIEEKLENLILYFKKKSSHFGDNVSWDDKKDYPITYSSNSQEFTKIRDLAKQRHLLYWRSRDSGLELSGDGWEMAEKLEKGSEMMLKEKRYQFLIKLNEMSGGDINKEIESMSIGKELGIDRETTFNFVTYFDQKGLIRQMTEAGDVISIKADGIDEVDRAKSETLAPHPLLDLGNDVFIVHGHDNEAKESVARFIEKLDLRAIILHEMPNIGRTLIEKFEDYSNVGFAVVLLTADDLGTSKDKIEVLKPRARQNVIFELGYFIGKLGRKRVCVLYKENVEIPSDYEGILYIEMDKSSGWKTKILREMAEIGIKIDPAKFLLK